MGAVVLLAFSAAFNPTELAAITVMLLLRNPGRLMLGYWLGAMTTGIASGLVIVFAFQENATEHTTRHAVSPIVQLVFAGLLLVAAVALAKSKDEHHEKKDKVDKKDKKPPRWQRTLERGMPGRPSWSGCCCRFPAPPTSPL